ncbi:hypothetical protein GCM10017708_39230 [Arthrobacter citreus]
MAAQVELAELDTSRTLLMEAEVRALRAQISPHFIYNSLNAIASYITTDPVRARELVVEFADFTRYTSAAAATSPRWPRSCRPLTVTYCWSGRGLATGSRSACRWVGGPRYGNPVPFTAAAGGEFGASRTGGQRRRGHLTITASDAGAQAVITVEDNGSGMDPEYLRAVLAGHADGDHVGLRNVDVRLRRCMAMTTAWSLTRPGPAPSSRCASPSRSRITTHKSCNLYHMSAPGKASSRQISVVVVDDELPAVNELAFLLGRDSRVGEVHRASSGAQALHAIETNTVDAVFLDIHMPALSGLDIARVLSGHDRPPAVVFVTADEEQALAAFDLAAVDYLLKPVRRSGWPNRFGASATLPRKRPGRRRGRQCGPGAGPPSSSAGTRSAMCRPRATMPAAHRGILLPGPGAARGSGRAVGRQDLSGSTAPIWCPAPH